MFFPYHLIGADEVVAFVHRWLDELGAPTLPDGGPDFVDLPGERLRVGPLTLQWSATSSLFLRMVVETPADRPAEPALLAAHFLRDGRQAWRYCRNDHHSDLGRDHLHLDDDARLVGLGDSLAMSHITARLLAEPR